MFKDPLLYLTDISDNIVPAHARSARFQELIDIIGLTAACRVIFKYGGYTFYCGKKTKHDWVSLVGDRHAELFFQYYGGCNVKFPQCKRTLARIMRHKNASCNSIAAALKVDVNTVSRWVKEP